MIKKTLMAALAAFLCLTGADAQQLPALKVSANHRFFTADDKPFFWLGDTGWLLFSKLTREEADQYLDTRAKQGFNVVQVMVVHSIKEVNAYGDSALTGKNIATPKVTPGNDPTKKAEYDYWDHVDYIVNKAAEKGLYVAMVPVWGSVVESSKIGPEAATKYATFLAERYKDHTNVIWMDGGDIAGSLFNSTWNAIGSTLKQLNPNHLVTYHPRGRTQSSTWFHNQSWLDFNTFQSGHRTYAQDTSKNEKLHYGEDNWRYVNVDYNLKPTKPTLDAEPSYERIPWGLHNIKLPLWTDADVRRYAYWSVFAGGCGYTYGNNDVMQMHKDNDSKVGAYGSTQMWYKSINNLGAQQMQWVKKLMLSRPYFERVPDQSMVAGSLGVKYNRLLATRGKNYAFVYTYNGRNFTVNATKLEGAKVKASWYNPRTGESTTIGTMTKGAAMKFNPPGEQKNGNDWVLVLDSI
ncbi:glycoside hydrolase family 140 protein [Mucilaginibacter yixingensis]|nr:glycoside hydrolase family 140 protein [Mucilaginibacter yixingensis]